MVCTVTMCLPSELTFCSLIQKLKQRKTEGKGLQLNTLLFWQVFCFPKNWAVKTKHSFTTDPFVFSHHIYLTARGEGVSKKMVTHTGCSIRFNGI